MEFDPKRAARVGAKKLRQREEWKQARREIRDIQDQIDDDWEAEKNTLDLESRGRDLYLNQQFSRNRKCK